MSRSCKECAHHNPDFIDEVCLHCSWPEFAGEPSNFKPKPITNYDRIVSKSPGELAEWLSCNCTGDGYGNSAEDWLDWLKQEVDDAGT